MAPRSDRGLDRLINFSDATVAIAITLLILPLVDIGPEFAKKPALEVLHENLGVLIIFVVTFVVIARFWLIHHRIFEYATSYNRQLITADLVWLCSIVFLPFAANMLAYASAHQPIVSAVYIGTMVVTSASGGAMEWVLHHDESITNTKEIASLDLRAAYVGSGLLVVALIVAVAVPAINIYALLALLLEGPILRLLRARRTTA